ncbi:MAG: hypothetical protein K6G09_02635, partial [Treponema sp.]|nr:hypothetical protein [Treponema sp.]
DGEFMKKEKVSSFDSLLTFVKANYSDFTDFINCCRKVHTLVFDYNSLCFLESSDKELEKESEKTADRNKTSLSDQIDSEINKITEKIKASFELDGLELNPQTVFNEVIMPLSEIIDK